MYTELALDADPITEFPIDLATLKAALRIEHSGFDSLLQNQHLPAAVQRGETFMRRAIVSRPHRWVIAELPYGTDQTLYLPRGRVSAVASVAVSVDGAVTTLRGPTSGSPVGTDYQEDLRGDRPRILPARGTTWPTADCDSVSPVVVTFTAGYTLAEMPEEIRWGVIAAVSEALDLAPPDQVGTLAGALTGASSYADLLWSAYRILTW